MFPLSNHPKIDVPRRRVAGSAGVARSGLTLVELLVAAAIMAMIVAALGMIAKAVQVSSDYGTGHGEAIQNARVVLERITRLANEATTSPEFPGMLVVPEEIDGVELPNTLVLWHPTGSPNDSEGLPCFNELVIFCPNPDHPNELIELAVPSNTGTVPQYSDKNAWATAIEGLKNSDTAQKVVLTNLLRVVSTDGTNMPYSLRPCVRFNVRLRPSEANLAEYEAGDVPWDELPWVQNIYSPSLGLRQVWLRVEMQLMPGIQARETDATGETALTFLDSTSIHYTVKEDN